MLKYKCKCSLSCCTTGVELWLLYPPKRQDPPQKGEAPIDPWYHTLCACRNALHDTLSS